MDSNTIGELYPGFGIEREVSTNTMYAIPVGNSAILHNPATCIT